MTMSTKTKHQQRQLASNRFQKLAKQCSFYAIAQHLAKRGYSFEQAHLILFGTTPEERQLAIREQQKQRFQHQRKQSPFFTSEAERGSAEVGALILIASAMLLPFAPALASISAIIGLLILYAGCMSGS
jgi:hypothetical protein